MDEPADIQRGASIILTLYTNHDDKEVETV